MNSRLPPLEDIEKIGEGAYGYVYKATNKITGESIVLKKIKSNPDGCVGSTTIREIQALKYLSHTNIVK